VLLAPLTFPRESQLVTLCEQHASATDAWCSNAPPTLEDIADRSRTIEAVGLARSWGAHLQTPDGAVAVDAGIATPDVFRALGVSVQRGRMLDSTDLIGRESDVALLTHEMWQSRFGGDASIIGRTLDLDGHAVRVVGVLAPAFHLPLFESVELWRPLHINPRDEQYRGWPGFVAYGRLRDGTSLADARADLARVAASVRVEHFATTPTWTVTTMPMRDLIVRGVRPALRLFLAAVALVLLVACANVANLLLAHGATRRREMAVRSALGAGSGRIVSEQLAESAAYGGVGAAVGLALAFGGVQAFRALAPAGMPRVDGVHVDLVVVTFAVALGLLTTLAVGLVPALRASRVDLAQAMREGGRGLAGRRSRLGTALVVVEVATAVALVAGAGTFARSFAKAMEWNPGFARENVALFTLSPSTVTYDSKAKLAGLWDRLEGSLAAIPGVAGVGTASAGPLFGGDGAGEMELEGRAPDQRVSVWWSDVSPGFFTALGVPLRAGRHLAATDVPDGPLVCVINEALASRYWPGGDAVGKRITFPIGDSRITYTVVGVVADVPSTTPGAPPRPEMYWSNRQQPRPYTWVLVRAALPLDAVTAQIRQAVHDLDRDLEVRSITTMTARVDRQLAAPRFNTALILTFGVVALALAAIGTYGMLAYTVALRRREIAIRLAIGAARGAVAWHVVRDGLGIVGAGLALGVTGYVAASRAVAALAPGVPARDVWVLGVATLTLLVIAALACAAPAWRASRVDPATALTAD
jgi:predicted permease